MRRDCEVVIKAGGIQIVPQAGNCAHCRVLPGVEHDHQIRRECSEADVKLLNILTVGFEVVKYEEERSEIQQGGLCAQERGPAEITGDGSLTRIFQQLIAQSVDMREIIQRIVPRRAEVTAGLRRDAVSFMAVQHRAFRFGEIENGRMGVRRDECFGVDIRVDITNPAMLRRHLEFQIPPCRLLSGQVNLIGNDQQVVGGNIAVGSSSSK